METCSFVLILITLFCSCHSLGASISISTEAEQPAGIHRRLLQEKTKCVVDFRTQNYTIITSQCKGPDWPKDPCCNSFKEFACQYTAYINNDTTDCAEDMFNYIRAYGSYPQGLFANMCVENTTKGLECPANITQYNASASVISSDAGSIAWGGSSQYQYILLLWCSFTVLLIALTDLFSFVSYIDLK